MQLELFKTQKELRIIYDTLNKPIQVSLVENVTEFKQLNRSVKFNLLGSSSSLHVPVNKLKGWYKSEFGETYIEIEGKDSVAVRDSLEEINNKINKRR
jgi:hypothetical protein